MGGGPSGGPGGAPGPSGGPGGGPGGAPVTLTHYDAGDADERMSSSLFSPRVFI